MQASNYQRLLSTFKTPKVFLPVIHLPDDGKHGMKAVAVALEAGADGVFLINQGTSTRNIVENLIPRIRTEFGRNTWIGVDGTSRQLDGCCELELQPGEALRIETPGGGGYGAPSRP